MPGNWVYRNGNYQRQPGFWSKAQNDWTWVPASYVWTPRGALFANGYWDYMPNQRGLMFSPMKFAFDPVFIPQRVVPFSSVFSNLFVQPNYSHYLFGDFYNPSLIGQGIYPWVNAGQYLSDFYDPMRIAMLAGVTPGARDQFHRMVTWHTFFQSHPGLRPAPTLNQALTQQAQAGGNRNEVLTLQRTLAIPLSRLSQLGSRVQAGLPLVSVSPALRAQFREEARETANLENQRTRAGTPPTSGFASAGGMPQNGNLGPLLNEIPELPQTAGETAGMNREAMRTAPQTIMPARPILPGQYTLPPGMPAPETGQMLSPGMRMRNSK